MAQMTIYDTSGFNDLWNLDFGGYATEALNECAPILEAKMKANAKETVAHSGDSEMVKSIKASAPKKSKNGAYIVNVGPRGYSTTKTYKAKKSGRSYPVSNALKAIWKEYGIPSRAIPANPFISRSAKQCESECYDILQKKFEEKLKI